MPLLFHVNRGMDVMRWMSSDQSIGVCLSLVREISYGFLLYALRKDSKGPTAPIWRRKTLLDLWYEISLVTRQTIYDSFEFWIL